MIGIGIILRITHSMKLLINSFMMIIIFQFNLLFLVNTAMPLQVYLQILIQTILYRNKAAESKQGQT